MMHSLVNLLRSWLGATVGSGAVAGGFGVEAGAAGFAFEVGVGGFAGVAGCDDAMSF